MTTRIRAAVEIRVLPFVGRLSDQNRQLEEDFMAKYLILIYESEQVWESASEEQWQAAMVEHERFTQQVPEQGGKILGGEALQPTSTATTVRGDVVTDGPFVETKEALGAYYVVEARDLDHAIALAKLCPAGTGGVELRPIMEVDG